MGLEESIKNLLDCRESSIRTESISRLLDQSDEETADSTDDELETVDDIIEELRMEEDIAIVEEINQKKGLPTNNRPWNNRPWNNRPWNNRPWSS